MNTNPEFGWHGVPGATSYELQIATDPGFTALAWDEPGIFPESTFLTQATRTNFGTYYWRVYATVPGAGSPVLVDGSPFQFRTQGGGFTIPQPFTLQSPGPVASQVDPSTLFAWTLSAGAMSTTLEVDPSGSFSPPPFSQPGIPRNRGKLPGPLAKGTAYYWRVVAIGQLGDTVSNVATFSTVSP